MKVPYATKWQKQAGKLSKIVLDCGLTEEKKWGKPCFTCQKKNVAIIIPLKEACALSFFKGALLKDPKHVLQTIGQAQAGRWIKFTSLKGITNMQSVLRHYIFEAIEVEKSGKKLTSQKFSEYAVPEELQTRLDASPKLGAAFEALTPADDSTSSHTDLCDCPGVWSNATAIAYVNESRLKRSNPNMVDPFGIKTVSIPTTLPIVVEPQRANLGAKHE